MADSVVSSVLRQFGARGTVDGVAAEVGVMHGRILNEGILVVAGRDVAEEMVVDGIASQDVRLSHAEELDS